jgi:hypothetical protein
VAVDLSKVTKATHNALLRTTSCHDTASSLFLLRVFACWWFSNMHSDSSNSQASLTHTHMRQRSNRRSHHLFSASALRQAPPLRFQEVYFLLSMYVIYTRDDMLKHLRGYEDREVALKLFRVVFALTPSAPSVLFVANPVNVICSRTLVLRVPQQACDTLGVPIYHFHALIQYLGTGQR